MYHVRRLFAEKPPRLLSEAGIIGRDTTAGLSLQKITGVLSQPL
jgi:hypothetical protein